MQEALSVVSPKDRIFMGHFCFGVHRMLDFPVIYITFLREPASRLISLYHYSRNNPAAHYYRVARNMTCEEFLFGSKLLEMDNGMTRFIAGDPENLFINRTPYGKCDRAMLDQALDNIERHFGFVGIQEEFDRSILLFAEVFNWPDPYYVSLNIGKMKTTEAGTDKDLLARIRESNPLDMELYETCRREFGQRFTAAFPDPNEALQTFRLKNLRYQKWAYPLYHARSAISQAGKKALKLIGS